MIRCIQL